MYAKAELHCPVDQVNTVSARNTVTAHKVRASIRSRAVRFLNWFGSGDSRPHLYKADQGYGTDFMLVHGQIIATPSCREETGADHYTK